MKKIVLILTFLCVLVIFKSAFASEVYRASFDLNGGTLNGSYINPIQENLVRWSKVQNPGNPVKESREFLGWGFWPMKGKTMS